MFTFVYTEQGYAKYAFLLNAAAFKDFTFYMLILYNLSLSS